MSQPASPTIIDVSKLPSHAFRERAPLFWGIVLLIAIEGTMFALLFATYLYVRGNFDIFPPSGVGRGAFRAATIGTACIVASAVPMFFVDRAARRHDLYGMRRWLIVTTVLCLAFLVARAFEIHDVPFRWNTNAYGSVFWTTLGMHTFHGITGTAENLMFIVLLFKGPVEKKHTTDLHVNAIYWFFVVAAWVPFYLLMYGENVLSQ